MLMFADTFAANPTAWNKTKIQQIYSECPCLKGVSHTQTYSALAGGFWPSHSRLGRTKPCCHRGQHVRVMFSLGSDYTQPLVQFGQRARGRLFIRVKTYTALIRCRSDSLRCHGRRRFCLAPITLSRSRQYP